MKYQEVILLQIDTSSVVARQESWLRLTSLADSYSNFSGQPKYCLDIKFDVKSSKSTKEKQKVFLAADQTYQKISRKKKIDVLSSDYDFFKMVEDNINGKLDRSKVTEDDLEKLRLGWKFLFFLLKIYLKRKFSILTVAECASTNTMISQILF